jgi:hypothetical protein
MTYRKKIAKREKNNEAEFQDNLMLKDEKKWKKKNATQSSLAWQTRDPGRETRSSSKKSNWEK